MDDLLFIFGIFSIMVMLVLTSTNTTSFLDVFKNAQKKENFITKDESGDFIKKGRKNEERIIYSSSLAATQHNFKKLRLEHIKLIQKNLKTIKQNTRNR